MKMCAQDNVYNKSHSSGIVSWIHLPTNSLCLKQIQVGMLMVIALCGGNNGT